MNVNIFEVFDDQIRLDENMYDFLVRGVPAHDTEHGSHMPIKATSRERQDVSNCRTLDSLFNSLYR